MGRYLHMSKFPWQGGNLCMPPYQWSVSCRVYLRVISLCKKKIRELGERKDFVHHIILDWPFCLLNPEGKTWIKRKTPLHTRTQSVAPNPLHTSLMGLYGPWETLMAPCSLLTTASLSSISSAQHSV